MSFCPQRGGGGWVSQHALQVSPVGGGIPACLASQSQGGGLVLGGVFNFLGVSNFSGGLQFLGGLQFFGGFQFFGGGLKGGLPNFFGGGNFFLISAFFGDTPLPPGPDTGIRSTFGRYASYWNACLSNLETNFFSSIFSSPKCCTWCFVGHKVFVFYSTEKPSILLADARTGGARETCPPRGSNSFIFMQFLGKKCKIIGYHTHFGSCCPPQENIGAVFLCKEIGL